MELEAIGHAETPYLTKFGVPRQPQLADKVLGDLVVGSAGEGPCAADVLLPGSYVWVLWAFSRNEGAARARFSPTVRPPRLGGNTRVGVFATRSSFRPNALALSALQVAGTSRFADAAWHVPVAGPDLVCGTPLYALWPYEPAADALRGAHAGWVDEAVWRPLQVAPVPEELLALCEPAMREGLLQVLALDPRPAYTRGAQEGREFWVPFANVIAWFQVRGNELRVTRMRRLSGAERRELLESGTLRQLRAPTAR